MDTEIPIESESSSTSISRHSEVKGKKSAQQSRNKSVISDAAPQPSKSGKAEIVNEERVPSVPEYKPEAWMIPKKQEDVLDQLNLAIVSYLR